MTRTPSNDAQQQPPVFKSLGLEAVMRSLRDDRKYSILDLGPAVGVNLEFWSRIPCRLYIRDFYRDYRKRCDESAGEQRSVMLAELLQFPGDTHFDIILAWDVFNYLDLQEIDELIQILNQWCRPGTILFALISTQQLMPAEPTLYKILDTERIIYEASTRETRACPRHQPLDFTRLMKGFKVSSSFLLRNGIREYVLVCSE